MVPGNCNSRGSGRFPQTRSAVFQSTIRASFLASRYIPLRCAVAGSGVAAGRDTDARNISFANIKSALRSAGRQPSSTLSSSSTYLSTHLRRLQSAASSTHWLAFSTGQSPPVSNKYGGSMRRERMHDVRCSRAALITPTSTRGTLQACYAI